MRSVVERGTRLPGLQRVRRLLLTTAVPALRRTLPYLVEARPHYVPCEWQGEMGRRMRAELRTFLGGVVGARVGETTGHLVNGVGPSTANHAQDLIHHHPSSITHHHCVRGSREKERERKRTCECGPRMICVMFLRRAADKGERKEASSGLPRLSPKIQSRILMLVPRYQGPNVVIIIVGSTKLHVHEGFLLSSVSNDYVANWSLRTLLLLSRMDFTFGGFTPIHLF